MRPAPSPPPPANGIPPRTTYLEAVTAYEEGMRTLQQRNFARAAELLGRVITAYPEEKELAERARLYLALCQRQIQPLDDEPRSSHERLYAATLALNAAEIERAIGYLERVLQDEPASDQALYMLAAAYTARGETELAIGYLQRAIATNPENRALARTDPDLAGIRSDQAVMALLDGPLGVSGGDERRRTGLSRNSR